MTFREPEYVYLAEEPSGLFKIGISNHVEKRLKKPNFDPALTLIKEWHRPDDARQIEEVVKALLYGRLQERDGYRGYEWFRVPLRRMLAAVNIAIMLAEIGAPPEMYVEIAKLKQARTTSAQKREDQRRGLRSPNPRSDDKYA